MLETGATIRGITLAPSSQIGSPPTDFQHNRTHKAFLANVFHKLSFPHDFSRKKILKNVESMLFFFSTPHSKNILLSSTFSKV